MPRRYGPGRSLVRNSVTRPTLLYNGSWAVGGRITVTGSSKYSKFAIKVSNWGDPVLWAQKLGDGTFNADEVDCWNSNDASQIAVGAMRIEASGESWTLRSAGRVCVGTGYAYPYGGTVQIYGVM